MRRPFPEQGAVVGGVVFEALPDHGTPLRCHRILVNPNLGLDEVMPPRSRRQLQGRAIEADCVLVADLARPVLDTHGRRGRFSRWADGGRLQRRQLPRCSSGGIPARPDQMWIASAWHSANL